MSLVTSLSNCLVGRAHTMAVAPPEAAQRDAPCPILLWIAMDAEHRK